MVLLPRQCLNIIGLGCSAFARHYLRNHFCFLLLWVLRCFSSPRSPSLRNDWPSTSRVAPFGNLGIKGYLHLPQAYRSLSRPSSPPRAKASTVCPCFSWEYAYMHYWIVQKNAPYYQVRLSERICLPRSTSTPFNELFRQFAALSRLRLHVTL